VSALPTRVEVKYCVPEAEAAAAHRLVAVFLAPDVASRASQRVTSLYLDSPSLTFLGWQRARRADRFKLRLRRYGLGAADIVFAEVKHKQSGRVHKVRAAIPSGAAASLLEVAEPCAAVGSSHAVDGLRAFTTRQRAYGAVPQALVRCQRQALRGTGHESALGVTFDRDVQFQPWFSRAFDEHPGAWREVPLPIEGAPGVIVELKHGGRPPQWMRRLMEQLDPWRQSFSKYSTVMGCVMREQRGVS
jgi:hypothetical protein